MKVKTHRQGGYSSGNITEERGDLYGSVTLHQDPAVDLQAANVNYVDQKAASIPAGRFATGEIPKETLPVLTGDVIKPEGTDTVVIAPTGIPNNSTHSKVTINNKGQVIGSAVFIESDVPELSFSHVETNKPTTVEGYGITNALKEDGGEFTGTLKVTTVSEDSNSLANLTFLETQSSGGGGSGVSVGGIIYRNSPTAPTGFLKCNGGEVSKTTYAALYSVVGDLFTYHTQPGAGKPWKQQYEINTEQSTDIAGWTTGPSLPGVLFGSQAIVTKNRVYLLGGQNNSVMVSTVYTAPINIDGTLGTWVTGTSLPGPLSLSQAIVTKNRVYLLGGTNGVGTVSTVYTAPINADGTLGSWAIGTSLPVVFRASQVIVTKNRVYLLGGYVNSDITTVHTAPINEDGTLGTWTTDTSLPHGNHASQAIVTKNRVYLLGGNYGSTVLTAPINADGTLGGWSAGGGLPAASFYSQAIVTKNRVYLLGGYNGSYRSTVYTAPINADGTLGTWTTGTSLPGVLGWSQVIVTKTRVYLLGGYNGSGVISTVYSAPFAGGSNDYSSYYDGTYSSLTNSDNFRLPTLTSNPSQSFAYIKY